MIQIFLNRRITPEEWNLAYHRIESITTYFPLKLIRIESYDGFSPQLDKEHINLHLEIDTPNEHIAFYGDRVSYTAGNSVRFYRKWDKQVACELTDYEIDEGKPITWHPPKLFKDDGSLPASNGIAIGGGYIDTRGALYEYAILAIGIMLENLLPGKVFLTAIEQDADNINKVVVWLTELFQEDFDLPLYFDKHRLLESFIDEYENKESVVGRMEELYRKKFKCNMDFSITHIGYEPTFVFYSRVLAMYSFGTFGFYDVLNPWIAVTKDLESALHLIAESKRILLQDADKASRKRAERYDFTCILKSLLNAYILWTPMQREQLDKFYTNRHALETGQEDLSGNMIRMAGYRIDICPMYVTQKELFEAFMYHDPENGTKYKTIIDSWVEKNADAYYDLKQKLVEIEDEMAGNASTDYDEGEVMFQAEAESFIQQYPEHEQFFIAKAIQENPSYIKLPEVLEELRIQLWEIYHDKKKNEHVQFIQSESKDNKLMQIKLRLKDLHQSINSDFEQWLEEEQDKSVLFFLCLLMSLKIYDRNRAYARQQMLYDRHHWNHWRKGQKYTLQ